MVPCGKDKVENCSGAGAWTDNEKLAVAVWPGAGNDESCTLNARFVNVPLCEGIPEMVPEDLLKVSPGGKVPDKFHRKGVIPPSAARRKLYGTLVVPGGRPGVEMERGGAGWMKIVKETGGEAILL